MEYGMKQISWFLAGAAVATVMFVGIGGRLGWLDADQAENGVPVFDMHDVDRAQRLFGLRFDEAQRDSMMDGLWTNLDLYGIMREIDLPNHVVPALQFNVLAAGSLPDLEQRPVDWKLPESVPLPENREELAFYPVEKLAVLIRDREITSLELTELYLDRIARFDDELMTVVTLTPELARNQARRADEELARGTWRGPLHGIPYGTKDLLDLAGYPSTWGSAIYKDQVPAETAAVIRKLEEAGAVHLAKLSLGELAWGDVWFGGMTRSPWNTEYGSSGSSAGSSSATAAGLVAFAIGSETLGSIVSPSTRNGVTGLRPTYDRVSREGAMALSWSMDKLGPITRSAHDAALVFDAIHGPAGDGQSAGEPARRSADARGTIQAGTVITDPVLIHRKTGVFDLPFNYEPDFDFENLRIGIVKSAFESDYGYSEYDGAVLEVLESLGAQLVPIDLPDIPASAIRFILSVEAAAAFDEVTRSGRDTLMVRQIKNAWPNVFRTARFVPAVEYIQANRIRTLLMEQMEEAIRGVDVYVSPSFAGGNLLITNLTGHPSVSVPTGFDPESGLPASITFNGHLFDEGTVLALARAYQSVTEHHRRIPPGFLDSTAPETGD